MIPVYNDTLSADAQQIATGTDEFTSYRIRNHNAYAIYVKLYDKEAADIDVSVDAPDEVITVPARSTASSSDFTFEFDTALSMRCTTVDIDDDESRPSVTPIIELGIVGVVGAAAGTDKQVQFNNDGVIAGTSDLIYDENSAEFELANGAALAFRKDDDTGRSIILKSDSNDMVTIQAGSDSGFIRLSANGLVRIDDGSGQGMTITTAGLSIVGPIFMDVLSMTPAADPPASPSEGMIYADTDHHLYYYNGTTWKQLDN